MSKNSKIDELNQILGESKIEASPEALDDAIANRDVLTKKDVKSYFKLKREKLAGELESVNNKDMAIFLAQQLNQLQTIMDLTDELIVK